jgi:hypothetical protein
MKTTFGLLCAAPVKVVRIKIVRIPVALLRFVIFTLPPLALLDCG